MTDRQRYLLLLKAVVVARYELRGKEDEHNIKAHGALNRGVELVKAATTDAAFTRDCAEVEGAEEDALAQIRSRR